MKILLAVAACLSIHGLSAYPGQMSSYEQQSLYNQQQQLRYQEQQLYQQQQMNAQQQSRDIMNRGTTRIGR